MAKKMKKKKCRGCGYHMIVGGMICCDYLHMVGHCRPCPPGDACTVDIPIRRKKAKNSAIDALA